MKPNDLTVQRLSRYLVMAMVRGLEEIRKKAHGLDQDLHFTAADTVDAGSEDRIIGLAHQVARIGNDLDSINMHLED